MNALADGVADLGLVQAVAERRVRRDRCPLVLQGRPDGFRRNEHNQADESLACEGEAKHTAAEGQGGSAAGHACEPAVASQQVPTTSTMTRIAFALAKTMLSACFL